MIGQHGCGEDRAFGAMRHARAKYAAGRHCGVAPEAEIDRQLVEESLNLLRRVEARKQPVFGLGQERVQPAAIGGHQ